MAKTDTITGRNGWRLRNGMPVRVPCFVTKRGQYRYGLHQPYPLDKSPQTVYRIVVRPRKESPCPQ